jgi:excisionase family DNA binding protein
MGLPHCRHDERGRQEVQVISDPVTPPEPGSAADFEALRSAPVQTIAEAARFSKSSVMTVRRAIASGDLPASKVGRLVRIPTAAVLAWIGAADLEPDHTGEVAADA